MIIQCYRNHYYIYHLHLLLAEYQYVDPVVDFWNLYVVDHDCQYHLNQDINANISHILSNLNIFVSDNLPVFLFLANKYAK